MCYLFGILEQTLGVRNYSVTFSGFGDTVEPRVFYDSEQLLRLDIALPVTVSTVIHQGRVHAISFAWVGDLEGGNCRALLEQVPKHLAKLRNWPENSELICIGLQAAQRLLANFAAGAILDDGPAQLNPEHDSPAWLSRKAVAGRKTGLARLDELEVPKWAEELRGDSVVFIRGLTRIPHLEPAGN